MDRDRDQVRLSEGVGLNEEGVCLSEEEIPLVVGWVLEAEVEVEVEEQTLPEHDQALATVPIEIDTHQTHLSSNNPTLEDCTSNLSNSSHRCLRERYLMKRKIFCNLWLRVPVCVSIFLVNIMVCPERWAGWLGPSEESHVPTADRVTRVFSGGNFPPPPPSSSSSEDGVPDHEEELEEVDFADMGKLFPQLHTAQASTRTRDSQVASSSREEVFTGVYRKRIHSVATPSSHPALERADVSPKKPNPVFIDTVVSEATAIAVHSITTLEHSTAALAITKDDEIVTDKPDIISSSQSSTVPMLNETTVSPTTCLPEDDTPTFFVDTGPTKPFAHRSAGDVVLYDRTDWGGAPLGEEDELIVYVAPHPRSAQVSPIPNIPRVRLPSRSVLTGTTNPIQTHPEPVAREDTIGNKGFPVQSEAPQFSSISFDFSTPSAKKQSRQRPVFTAGDRSKVRIQAMKQDARVARKRAQRRAMFGSFGAMLSEARLRDADERERKSARWESRRKDDSDVDFGDDDEDDPPANDGVDEVSNGLGGMDLDPDVEPDLEAMKGFVQSMSAEGLRHRTIDEIQDEEQMRMEDEEEDGSDSHGSYNNTSDEEDKEENAVFEVEEEILIAESEGGRPREPSHSDHPDETEDSSDDELSPGASFQARLRRVREKSRSMKPETTAAEGDSEEEESDTPFPLWNRGDSDDYYIARMEVSRFPSFHSMVAEFYLQDMLEMHSGIAGGKDRKLCNKLFRAIRNGQFDHVDDYEELDGTFSYQPASWCSYYVVSISYLIDFQSARKTRLRSCPPSFKRGGREIEPRKLNTNELARRPAFSTPSILYLQRKVVRRGAKQCGQLHGWIQGSSLKFRMPSWIWYHWRSRFAASSVIPAVRTTWYFLQ